MDVSDEAIVLFYLLNDGNTLSDVTTGDSVTVRAVSKGSSFTRLSSTLTNRYGRMMYSSHSKLALKHEMDELICRYFNVPITITSELIDQSRFYDKFMEV